VKTYYGRDNLSGSDLHAVLLLSVGPQEHRRLLKKGLNEGDGASARSQNVSSQVDPQREGSDQQSHPSISLQEDGQPSSFSTSEQATSDTGPSGRSKVCKLDKNESCTDERDEDVLPPNEEDVTEVRPLAVVDRRRRHPRHKNRRNESLLGHAVHGRRVVEILMEQGRDEEIIKFCQRWRKVFVDALQPAFLPLGWEISHRLASKFSLSVEFLWGFMSFVVYYSYLSSFLQFRSRLCVEFTLLITAGFL
jgi:cation-transporting P-type ATPase D